MSNHRFSRRSILAGMGLSGAYMPLIFTQEGWAAPAGRPKRLVILQTTNGVIDSAFWPGGQGDLANQTLPEILSPLEPHKKDILVLGGIDMKVAQDDPAGGGNSHDCLQHLLTGQKGATGIKDGKPASVGNSISVDQAIANALKMRTGNPRPSLEAQVSLWGYDGKDGYRAVSLRGPATGSNPARPDNVLPELSPYKVFDRFFSNFSGKPGEAQPMDDLRARRKSVLDVVGKDLEAMSARLGTEDRQKIQSHLTSIRDLETQMTGAMAQPSLSCSPPMLAPNVRRDAYQAKQPSTYPQNAKMHLDLIVAGMACDQVRVVTLMMSGPHNAGMIMDWLGPDFAGKGDEFPERDHHDMTHRQGQSPDHTRRKITAEKWFMSQYAYLIAQMKRVPEMRADGTMGTMLDNSVVAILNTGSNGAAHSITNLPWVIAGSCGGYFKTGRYIKYAKVPHNGLLVAFSNAMDVPVQTYGDPQYGGELQGVRG